MLSLRFTVTHCRTWVLGGALLSIGALAEPARVGVGDSRDGYDDPAFVSRSAELGTVAGERLSLADLAANPPLGLPALAAPLNPAAVDLGRRLFFDRRLSVNGTLSCGMCHVPEQGFAQNELATPVGLEGRSVRRNAPSLYNVAYAVSLFHDGREAALERQIWEPLLADNEMGNGSRPGVLRRVAELDDYAARFAEIYAEGLSEWSLGHALAEYQRGLLSAASRFDRWRFAGARDALSELEGRGYAVFTATGCSGCHTIADDHALFSNGEFYNTGIGYAAATRAASPARVQLAPGVFVKPSVAIEVRKANDDGRYEVTGRAEDIYRYRTPSLRNVALTAPYMHDGSLRTLEAVVAYYDAGGSGDARQDPRIRPLGLDAQDRRALVAFLESLTGANVDALASDARSVAIGDVSR